MHFFPPLPQNLKWTKKRIISRFRFATHNTLIIWSIIFSLWHLKTREKVYLRFISFIENVDVLIFHTDIPFNYCSRFKLHFVAYLSTLFNRLQFIRRSLYNFNEKSLEFILQNITMWSQCALNQNTIKWSQQH